MPARKPPPHDNPEQSKRFIDMAREVEADETPGAMDRAMKEVTPPPSCSPDRQKSQSIDSTRTQDQSQ